MKIKRFVKPPIYCRKNLLFWNRQFIVSNICLYSLPYKSETSFLVSPLPLIASRDLVLCFHTSTGGKICSSFSRPAEPDDALPCARRSEWRGLHQPGAAAKQGRVQEGSDPWPRRRKVWCTEGVVFRKHMGGSNDTWMGRTKNQWAALCLPNIPGMMWSKHDRVVGLGNATISWSGRVHL